MKTPTVPDVAALISAAESADLSRVEIARRAGLSPTSITRLANGERGIRPSAATVFKLQGVVANLPIGKR